MKTKKINNGVFYIALCIVLFITLLCSCTKREPIPDQIILWENATSDTITILIDGINGCVGLRPHQSWVKGDASWLNRTYTKPGTADHIQIQMRNTITSKY